MTNFIIGMIAATSFFLLQNYVRQRGLKPAWWAWVITVLAFAYGVFVLLVIAGFLEEGSPRAALVMGSVLGFVAVIWGVLLGRFVFSPSRKARIQPEADEAVES